MDQVQFMKDCREQSDGNFAQELGDLLGVNLDAAYRRIRGATPLTFDEIGKICLHYKVSFDSNINYQGQYFPFQFRRMFEDNDFEILDYLQDILDQLRNLKKDPQASMTITAMDLPYFMQFGYSGLRKFKLYYWRRSVLNLKDFRLKKFSAEEEEQEYEEVMEQIYRVYHEFDSTEIWAPETLDSTLKQIEYGLESGFFKQTSDAITICNDLISLLNKMEREAMVGKKTLSDDIASSTSKLAIYQSDILLSNNAVQVSSSDHVYTYVSFNSFNSLMSRAEVFSRECSAWIEQLRIKSIMLSDVSEKHRYQFFKNLKGKVDLVRNRIDRMAELA
jgi:hypothetical protein